MTPDRRAVERLGVLVVEPKDLVAARLTRLLERLGHRVLQRARDGREAIAAARALRPDLVLVERLLLPELDGIETARVIAADGPVPIILLSGYAGAELVRQAADAGVVAFLTVIDQPRLRAAITGALVRDAELRALCMEGRNPIEARAARRLVDRAKRALIVRRGLSEAEAFRQIEQRERRTRWTLHETALAVIGAEEILSGPGLARTIRRIVDSIHPAPASAR
jgi:AmiR/NasT family two-component response regulator